MRYTKGDTFYYVGKVKLLSDFGTEVVEANAQQFRCPGCHADMAFDPTTGAMLCEYCGAQVSPVQSEGTEEIVEYDLEHGLASQAKRGFGETLRRSRCQDCGASVCFGGNATATRCDFCSSNQVLEQTESRNVIRPESLVAFAVGQDSAQQAFRAWIRGLWFRPNDLKHRAKVAEITGMYVPYWTFDALVHSDWSADAGYYYYVTETYTTMENGKSVTRTRQVRKTRWVPAHGSRKDVFDDVLVCASGGVPKTLVRELSTFDTSALVPYSPSYLAGFKAEEYVVALNDAWTDAVEQMGDLQRRRCSNDVPGDTQRFLNVRNHYTEESFKHVLLPIWISSYQYGAKVHQFLVNGQTGEVTGTAPWSWIKITLCSLLILGIVGGGIYWAKTS